MFESLEAAQAAFALGAVRFRCGVCRKVHWSISRGVYSCLRSPLFARLSPVRKTAHTYAAVLQLQEDLPTLVSWGSWGWVPFFVRNEREWDDLQRLRTVFLRETCRQALYPFDGEPAALAVPPDVLRRHYAAWRAVKEAELEAWAREFDRERQHDYHRLEDLAKRLCVPQTFPGIEEIARHRWRKTGELETVVFAVGDGCLRSYPGHVIAQCMSWELSFWPSVFGKDFDCILKRRLIAIETEPDWAHMVLFCSAVLNPVQAPPRPRKVEIFVLLRWVAGQARPEILGAVPEMYAASVPDALEHLKPLEPGGLGTA